MWETFYDFSPYPFFFLFPFTTLRHCSRSVICLLGGWMNEMVMDTFLVDFSDFSFIDSFFHLKKVYYRHLEQQFDNLSNRIKEKMSMKSTSLIFTVFLERCERKRIDKIFIAMSHELNSTNQLNWNMKNVKLVSGWQEWIYIFQYVVQISFQILKSSQKKIESYYIKFSEKVLSKYWIDNK